MGELKELRVNQEGMLPSFSKEIYDYYLTINENISSLDIEAIPEDNNAIVEIIGNNDIKLGENLISIKIITEEAEAIYNIQVLKTNNIETYNCNLEMLAVQEEFLNPAFDSNVTNYEIEVSNDVTNLNILAIPEDEEAQVEIKGANQLRLGNNTIEIVVTSQDNSTQKIYRIEAYKRTIKETNEYNQMQEESYEKAQELLVETSVGNEYDTEKLNLVTEYKSNNEIIKMGILLSILFVIVILVVLKNNKINNIKK